MDTWVKVPFDVDKKFEGFRVDRFLAQRLAAYTRSRVQKILEEARVTRNDHPLKASAKVHGGDKIFIAYPRKSEEPLPPEASIPVLFEDEALIVIHKPANLLSHPTDKILKHTVLGVLKHGRPDLPKLYLLHRLDRDTSGVLVIGKTLAAARAWTQRMEQREIKKEYLALVKGVPSPRKGLIDRPIGRKPGNIHVRQGVDVPGAVPAVTRYEVAASLTPSPSPGGRGETPELKTLSHRERGDRGAVGEASVVRVYPETGRLHQIRVHLASFGCPLLGDALYNGDGSLYLKMTRHQITEEDRESLGFPRVALHAARITFSHPLTGQSLTVAAPLPQDMSDFLEARGVTKIDTLTPQ